MSKLIERLRQHWLNQGIALGNGASETQVEELESKYHIVLPDDFKEYLLSISWPVFEERWEIDDYLISFWEINRIKNLKEKYPHFKNSEVESYFIFADYSLSCHTYAIKLQQKVAITPIFFTCYIAPDYPIIQIASSFTEFLERYIANDERMLFLK
jgi:hypothetical protein